MRNPIDLLNQAILERDKHIMAKKTAVAEDQALTIPSVLTPAQVQGLNTSKISIDPASLPDEFKGVTFEVIETGFDPTVKWNKPGDFIIGVYTGQEKEVGPNKARLYNFDAKGRAFGVWGTTVLDRAFDGALKAGILKPGYLLMITYAADVPSDYEANPTKLFHMQVAKK